MLYSMKNYFLFIFYITFFFSSSAFAQSYSEVWFENSPLPIRYGNSEVRYEGKSWIKNISNQLPVSDSIFFTPNNALELQYSSAKDGRWETDIFYPQSEYILESEDAKLTFKLFIESETEAYELPALSFIHSDSTLTSAIALSHFINKIERNKWISVEIPLRKSDSLYFEKGLRAIRFSQHGEDGKEHVLFIDQIELMPSKVPNSPLTSAAILSTAVGFQRHVNLTWKLPLTPSIRYVKVYRSDDNKKFQPVAIRPIFLKRFSDYVPESEQTYYYKISWVDYFYNESPMSNVLKVKTEKMTDSALLKMVQNTSARYFKDGEEFNSGMQLKNIMSKEPVVSLKSTGAGILALIADVKDDFEKRTDLLRRLEKIVSFIEIAESAHGAYPELMNGRTGKALRDSSKQELIIDLESTAILIQALIVSKEYFNQDKEDERLFRERIDKLWRMVEWNAFKKEGVPYLFSHWSASDSLSVGRPLSGIDKTYLYVLALASPDYNIEVESYYEVLQHPLIKKSAGLSDSLGQENNSNRIENLTESIEDLKPLKASLHHSGIDYYTRPYITGEFHFGLDLPFSSINDDLTEVMKGFMALDPSKIQSGKWNYKENIRNLITIQYRKKLEYGGDWSDSKIYPAEDVVSYPFNEKLGLKNIKDYYLKHNTATWSEYGFVREIDFERNEVSYSSDGLEAALSVIMLENAQSSLIWKLFFQHPGIKEVVEVVFRK